MSIVKHSRTIGAFINSNEFKQYNMEQYLVTCFALQFGGINTLSSMIDVAPRLMHIANTTGYNDKANLQSLYNQHRTEFIALLEDFDSNQYKGDVISYICLNCPTASTEHVIKGLHDTSIKDNTGDDIYLEAARFVVRRVLIGFAERYQTFLENTAKQDVLAQLLTNDLPLVGSRTIIPSSYAQALTELVGGYDVLITHTDEFRGKYDHAIYSDATLLNDKEAVNDFYSNNIGEVLHLVGSVALMRDTPKYQGDIDLMFIKSFDGDDKKLPSGTRSQSIVDLIFSEAFEPEMANDVSENALSDILNNFDLGDNEYLQQVAFIVRRYMIILGLANLCRSIDIIPDFVLENTDAVA